MTATKFSRNTLSYIVVSQKFKLKLISVKFFAPYDFPQATMNSLEHYLLYGMTV